MKYPKTKNAEQVDKKNRDIAKTMYRTEEYPDRQGCALIFWFCMILLLGVAVKIWF